MASTENQEREVSCGQACAGSASGSGRPEGMKSLSIEEIYGYFDRIGCAVFATIDGDYPSTRIAHFVAFDDDGLYFTTMNVKPFYRQLKAAGTVSVCAMSEKAQAKGDNGQGYYWEPGYQVRLTGDVREVSLEVLKAKNNPVFTYAIDDIERYPATRAFVVWRGKGEVYDYDYNWEHRDHKIERFRFSFGNAPVAAPGLSIDADACIGCGTCASVCTFDAIEQRDGVYAIRGNRCDECGSCQVACPVGAIVHKGGWE